MKKDPPIWIIFIFTAVSVAAFLVIQASIYSSDQVIESILASANPIKPSNATPQFSDYPVAEIYTGNIAPVNLNSHSDAMTFKTRLKEGVDYYGVDFAGHYTVVEIGCGTSCQTVFIVDAKNGAVYRAPFVSELGVKFIKESNLLIENPPESIKEFLAGTGYDSVDWLQTRYYVWENNGFKLVLDEPFDEFIGYPEWIKEQ